MVPILPIVIKDMERSSLIVILPENKKVKHCQTEKGDRPKPCRHARRTLGSGPTRGTGRSGNLSVMAAHLDLHDHAHTHKTHTRI